MTQRTDDDHIDEEPVGRRSTKRWLVWLGAAWLLVIGGGVLWALTRGDDGDGGVTPTTEVAAPTTQVTVSDPPVTTEAPTPTTTAPVETTTTTTVPPSGPSVVATLDGGAFTLSGVVPTEESAAALLEAANTSYAPYVDATALTVDPGVGDAPWLEAAPSTIGLIPMITEGSIRFGGDDVELAGRSPNPAYLGLFEQTITQIVGKEPASVEVEITNLVAPVFEAQAQGGQVALSGILPSPEIQEVILGGAVAAYGEDNVTASFTIDEGVYTSFWMYTMPQVFQLFTALPEYEFTVIDGVTSGAMRGGITFGFDSAQVDPAAADILQVAGSILQRDRSLGLLVEGHTDSVGPADYNTSLGLARAQAIVDFLAAAGVDAQRMFPVGIGEGDPVADNSTPEGRALNRRVEFRFDVITNLP